MQIKKKLEDSKPIPYSDDEALAYLLDMKMTVSQYQKTRKQALQRHADIFHNILAVKKRCYSENITIDDFSAEVLIQDLMDHAIKRIIQL